MFENIMCIFAAEIKSNMDIKEAYAIYDSIVIEKTRENSLHPDEHLNIRAERNERFAEMIAEKFGLEYVQQSCIVISDENMKDVLESARMILSEFMDVSKMRRPMTDDGVHKWLFTFYSES